jgi:AmiR/NasT family two-component response regulator
MAVTSLMVFPIGMDGSGDRLMRLWLAHWRRATEDLIVIEQATGVLMVRRGCKSTQARTLLLCQAKAAHLTLGEMARAVVARRW